MLIKCIGMLSFGAEKTNCFSRKADKHVYEEMKSQVLYHRAKFSKVTHRASYWKAKVLGICEGSTMKTNELHHEIELLKDQTF